MSNRDLMESKKKDSVYNNGNINLDAIGELIENSLANCFDNDDKKKLYQERFSNIYKQVLSSCLADNHDLLEDLCAEIVVIEQSLLKTKISENSYKIIGVVQEHVLIHYCDIAFQIAKNKYFGIRNSLLVKYLKPIYLNFSELVAENIKSKMSNIISETIYDLNYSSGLGRRVSIRLGIASSGYNINI